MSDKSKKNKGKISYILTRETMGMTILLFCAIVLLMLLTGSAVFAGIGKAVCTFMYGTFGYGSYLVLALLAYLGEWLTFEKKFKISFKKAITISLTAFMLFLLFHAVTTRGYALAGYGKYISECYTNAQNGFSGYTFGGVISAIFVYPVSLAGGFVTCYVVFSILTLLLGYLTFLAFKRGKFETPARNKVKKQVVRAEEPAPEAVVADQPVQSVHYQQPAQIMQTSAPVVERQAEEDDAFSQKNLGRKILFTNGEFAAESYRRNMIFNENSYFSRQTSPSEDDYLSSFTTKKKEQPAEKSYVERYQEEVYEQPVSAMPTSYVHGDKPVEELEEQEQGSSYGVSREEEQPSAQAYDQYLINEQYRHEEQYVEPEEESVEEEPPVQPVQEIPPVQPVREQPIQQIRPAERGVVGFTDGEQNEREEEKDGQDDPYGFLERGERRENRSERVERTERAERSRAELFDNDEEDEDDVPEISENAGLRSGRREQTAQSIQPLRQTARREQPVQPEPVSEEKPKGKHVWKQYVPPTLELLDDYPENANVNTGEIENNKRVIVETLERFRITSEVANVTIGPAITRYDVIIEDKINIKRSVGYRDAIAMALMKDNVNAYLNYSKGALSIEVPNNDRAVVGIKTMLASPRFINGKKNSLTFTLGKNVEGQAVCPDITKMPHLLVAGTTGSGKSICLSVLLISLLYKYSPEELRLILVDPKQVEFSSYDKLPHLMINEIIYDCDKAIKALNWAIKEMDRRYSLFKDMTDAGKATKSLDEYNAHLAPDEEKLPKIVIVLDEFGDLMLQAKREIEGRIIKLVQKARACGIHLILATQRPSVNCITGLIKSNLPTRIGFKVSSFEDSRTIFDLGGAEKLLGKGDLYLRSPDSSDLQRIQCCFIDTPEVQRVTDFIKEHNETYFDQSVSDFINTVEQPADEGNGSISSIEGEDGETKIDDTFIKALKFCVTSNQASVSMIQRRFPVGYIKACKIIDWMENMNYVTPSEGSKPRKVLLSKEEFFNTYGDVDD